MSLEPQSQRSEQLYKSWYDDPEQVENLVLMLEEKMIDGKGRERWKYGSGHAYSVLFPTDRLPWAEKYKQAPIPKSRDSFKSTLTHLVSGRHSFGPTVPNELTKRFFDVMAKRVGKHPHEQIAFWDDPRKLVAAGLIEYCGLTAKQAGSILKEKIGYVSKSPHSLFSARSAWIRKREFPYEERRRLVQNNPLVIAFVDYLRALTGLTPQDMRAFIIRSDPTSEKAIKHIENFINTYEKYRAGWQSGGNPETAK